MFGNFLFVYLLGAVTFWPIVGVAAWYLLVHTDSQVHSSTPDAQPEEEDPEVKEKPLNSGSPESLRSQIDRESNVEASGWVRVAPTYINKLDQFEETNERDKQPLKSSKSSLRKLVSRKFFNNKKGSKDGAAPTSTDGTVTAEPGSSTEARIPKTVQKCPKFWAVVRGGQLQLFEDQSERKVQDIVFVPSYVVLLWPQSLQEFELFYKRYPICLVHKFEPSGLAALDLTPGVPPKKALYLYTENGCNKEDLYFALIKESARKVRSTGPTKEASLGPRDPRMMARPYRALRGESQHLLSQVWNSEANGETQWLNGLLGRIFLAVKNTPVLDEYLRKKFNYKLRPISLSSNIIGDIDIHSIDCGTAAPIVSHVKLKELTTDGNLVASMGVHYEGGFKVILGTNVKLAAISSLTSAEIPVELACTVTKLTGSLTIRIKPPPSDRIWYAFESMPSVDLHIEPTVYHKHISLSVVTRFIKSKLLDSLRDSMVYPYMDDFSFYNTSQSFYRGGIWFPAAAGGDESTPWSDEDNDVKADVEESPEVANVAVANATVAENDKHSASATELMNSSDTSLGDVSIGDSTSSIVPSAADIDVQDSVPALSPIPDASGSTSASPVPSVSSLMQPVPPTSSSSPIASTSHPSTRQVSQALEPTTPTKTTRYVQSSAVSEIPRSTEPRVPKATSTFTTVRKPVPPRDLKERRAFTLPGLTQSVSEEQYAADLSSLPNSGRFDFSSLLGEQGDKKVARKPVPAPRPAPARPASVRSLKPEFPSLAHADASIELSNEAVEGEISEPPERSPSIAPSERPASLRLRRQSVDSMSSGSSKAPSLPPRTRRVVPLVNVPPEGAATD